MALKRLVSFVWSTVKLVIGVILLVRLVSYLMGDDDDESRSVPVS